MLVDSEDLCDLLVRDKELQKSIGLADRGISWGDLAFKHCCEGSHPLGPFQICGSILFSLAD